MEDSSRESLPGAKGATWRVIWSWIIAVMILVFAVSSIAYDMGQESRNAEIQKVQEKYEYGEDVRNKLRESRDSAEERSLRCLRALDSSNHYLAYKGDILYDVYLADTPEKMEKAKARVSSWYKDRGVTQERLDKQAAECTSD